MANTQHTNLKKSEYVLVGSEHSIFTAKARAYMRWKGISFREMIASDDVFKTIIKPYGKVLMIPLLLVPDLSPNSPSGFWGIQDTKEIIEYFETTYPASLNGELGNNNLAPHPVVPAMPKRAFAAMLLEMLGDEWLLVQSIYWRWGDGIYERQNRWVDFEFGNVVTAGQEEFGPTLEIGKKAGSKFKNICTALGITPATSPAIEKQFHNLLALLSRHFEKFPYLLGNTITIADFAFIGSFYGHLIRDPVPSFIIKTEAPLVNEWIERVMGAQRWGGKNAVKWDNKKSAWISSYGKGKSGNGLNEEKDEIPSTTIDFVRFLMRDYLPILKNTLDKTAQFIAQVEIETPMTWIPRTVGEHTFHLHDIDGKEAAEGKRLAQTHATWMFQRIIDRAYATPEQEKVCDAWLEEVGEGILRTWKGCVEDWRNNWWYIARSQNKLVARKVKKAESKL